MTPDDDDDLPPARGPERTVMVSAADLAAIEGATPWPGAAPVEPPLDPFAAAAGTQPPAGGADPFGVAAGPAVVPDPVIPVPPPTAVSTPPAAGVFTHGTPGGLVGIHLNDLFEIVRFIAQGGMGEVYEGRNIASGEKVAIKVILPQYAADEQFMALFRREASALERIGHDSLVKYRTLAFDRTSRINYLAIEYVSGPSMADVLVGEPADPAMVRRVLKRLATGLGAAHEAGVIHRDLSPDNLLLPDGRIERCKIIDFGIAKDTNPGEKSVVGEAFAGKFGYAAPEIFGKFKRQVGPWTDVYSLALVMIAYARGAPLDMGVTIVDALEARDTVPDLSSIAPDLQPVFARMLAPDPAERFRSMDEVVAALDAPAGSLGTVLPPTAPTQPPTAPAFVRATTATPAAAPTPAEKSKLPLYGGIAAAVLLVAGGGGYALLGGGGKPSAPTEQAAPAPDAAPASPTTAAPAVADWASVRPQVIAALNGVGCSDLRVDGTPAGGTVRLAGWFPAGALVPDRIAGWSVDAARVAQVDQPAAETCALIGKLRAAVPAARETGLTMPGLQGVGIASAPRDPTGLLLADLKVSGLPADLPQVRVVNIDNAPPKPSERVVSYTRDELRGAKYDLDRVGYEAKPARYLGVVIASRSLVPAVTNAGPPAALAAACAGGGCALASGWIEVR